MLPRPRHELLVPEGYSLSILERRLKDAVLDLAEIGTLVLDRRRRVIMWNRWMARTTGIPREHAVGLPLSELFPELRNDRLDSAIEGALKGNMSATLSHSIHKSPLPIYRNAGDRSQDLRIEQNIDVTPIDLGSRFRCCLLQIHDVTAAVARERALREQSQLNLEMATTYRLGEARLKSILDTAVDAIITIDSRGIIQSINAATERLFGFTAGEAVGQNISLFMPAPDHNNHDRYIREYLQSRISKILGKERESIGRRKDGSCFPIELSVSEVAVGEEIYFCGIIRDISVRKQQEELLSQEKERAQTTLASIADAVIATDASGRIETVNRVAEKLMGLKGSELVGLHLADVLILEDEQTGEVLPNLIGECLQGNCGIYCSGTAVMPVPDRNARIAIDYSNAPIADRNGTVIGAVMVFRDVTPQRMLIQQVTYQATHDVLTGLVNRAEFERRLGLMMEHAGQHRHQHALLYLDLDQFKLVNDTCGHAAGDELLRQLTAILKSRLRERDTLARLGGDEFGVLLGNCSKKQAATVANELRELVNDFRFAWDGRWFTVGVSIGLVPFGDAGTDLQTLMSTADSACYLAKEQGRNRVITLQPGCDDCEQRRDEMRWAARLSQALIENRFLLYYQPIVSLCGEDGAEHGEILLRLIGEDGKVYLPGAFIPAAERYHQMAAIDRWVVKETFRSMAALAAAGDRRSCSVNLSGQSLGTGELLDYVRSELAASGVDPKMVCFEITETAAIGNLSAALEFIAALKAEGCSFALDDFGNGLSSLVYLKSLPVDYLKIDGHFVKDLVEDPVDFAMVEAIHRVSQVIGLKTVAERVENAEIMAKLQAIGIDFGQGFGIAKPRPLHIPVKFKRSCSGML